MGHDVNLCHLHLELAVSYAVEVQKLVHKGEHPGGVSAYDVHKLAVFPAYGPGRRKLLRRPRNHGKRGAELMCHVGKIVHLDLVQGFFGLFGFFGPLTLTADLPDTAGGLFANAPYMTVECVYDTYEKYSQKRPQAYSPPACIPWRQHLYGNGGFAFGDAAAAVCNPYPEGIVSRRQVCKIGVVAGANFHPVLVKAFQLVGVADLLKRAVIQGSEGYAEGVFRMPDYHRGIPGQRPHHAVMDGEAFEHQWNGAPCRSVQGIEGGEPVRAAEHQRSVRKDT